MDKITEKPLMVKEVPKLYECQFCKEIATVSTENNIFLCGKNNHPEYENDVLIPLILTTPE